MNYLSVKRARERSTSGDSAFDLRLRGKRRSRREATYAFTAGFPPIAHAVRAAMQNYRNKMLRQTKVASHGLHNPHRRFQQKRLFLENAKLNERLPTGQSRIFGYITL